MHHLYLIGNFLMLVKLGLKKPKIENGAFTIRYEILERTSQVSKIYSSITLRILIIYEVDELQNVSSTFFCKF